MTSDPISSWKTEKVETVTDIILLGSRITADGDCSHKIKRRFFLGEKTMTNLSLLLLSHVSRVRLCATPLTAAHQAPPSLGFSRQEHWSGLPFPSLMRESEVVQSCPTLRYPIDCSLPDSSVHGSFQARVLEWVIYLPSAE